MRSRERYVRATASIWDLALLLRLGGGRPAVRVDLRFGKICGSGRSAMVLTGLIALQVRSPRRTNNVLECFPFTMKPGY